MALQGTIDTFPLTDVLALLASSSRSGRLTLTGDRGSGTMWIHDQAVLGGELADGTTVAPDRITFELLRFEDGSFEFDSVDRAAFPDFQDASCAVEECVTTGTQMLEEWTAIEAVVPSVAHRVDLAAELPTEEMTVDRALWRVLVTVSRCSSVSDLAAALGVDDYEGSALVASMVTEGFVEVSEPWDIDGLLAQGREQDELLDRLTSDVDVYSDDAAEIDGSEIGLFLDEEEAHDTEGQGFPDHFPIDDLISGDEGDAEDLWNSPAMAKLEEQRRSDEEAASSVSLDSALIDAIPLDGEVSLDGDGDSSGLSFDGWDELVGTEGDEPDSNAEEAADEVLRQMSKLSPKAAEAIAAALGTGEPAADGPALNGSALNGSGSNGSTDHSEKKPSAADPGPISFLDSF